MPRVKSKTKSKAGKPYSCIACRKSIVAGQKYFEWAFFRQAPRRKHDECGRPKQSELDNSKMSAVYAAIEGAEESIAKADSKEDIAEALDEVVSSANEVAEEYGEAADAMGGAGESGISAERKDALESFASEVEDAANEIRDAEPEEVDEEVEKEKDLPTTTDEQQAAEKEMEFLDGLREQATDALNGLSV